MKILINTCKKYSPATLPPLIRSLNVNGFGPKDIIVVEGGHFWREVIAHPDYTYIKASGDSIDYNAMVDLVINKYITDKSFLYLHDTLVLGENFKINLEVLFEGYDRTSIWDQMTENMNLGIYKTDLVYDHTAFILDQLQNHDTSEEGMNHHKCMCVFHEDFLFVDDSTPTQHLDAERILLTDEYAKQVTYLSNIGMDIRYLGGFDWKIYGEDKENRRIEYFPNIDFYKFKANFMGYERLKVAL